MTDPRIHARRVGVERERGRRRLHVVLGTVVVAGLAAGSIALLHSSLFAARQVVIAGNLHTGRAQLLRVAGLSTEPPLVDVDPAAVARRLDRLPWVASVRVRVEWPSTVALAVVERVPVAAIARSGGGYALVDETGRVLGDQRDRPPALPLVSATGLLGAPGSRLEPSDRPLLAAAAALPVSLVARVSTIEASATGVVVVKLSGGQQALLGDAQSLALKYESLATVLQRMNLAGIGSIDLRAPATPLLTPLVARRIVQAKGGG